MYSLLLGKITMTAPVIDSNHRVVNRNHRHAWLIKIILVIVFFGLLIFSYNFTWNSAAKMNKELEQVNHNLLIKVKAMEVERQQYLQNIAILERGRKIDKMAQESVSGLIKELEDDKAVLNKELSFFRSIIAPEDNAPGVRIYALNLARGGKDGVFRFRWIISQASKIHSFLKGVVSVMVEGSLDGKDKSLSLFKISGLDSSSVALGFRYFQVLPDNREFFEFTLPKGYIPKSIGVNIRIRSGAGQKLYKLFDWDKEMVTDVEKDRT